MQLCILLELEGTPRGTQPRARREMMGRADTEMARGGVRSTRSAAEPPAALALLRPASRGAWLKDHDIDSRSGCISNIQRPRLRCLPCLQPTTTRSLSPVSPDAQHSSLSYSVIARDHAHPQPVPPRWWRRHREREPAGRPGSWLSEHGRQWHQAHRSERTH